jgi:hypothetical protein
MLECIVGAINTNKHRVAKEGRPEVNKIDLMIFL